MKKRAHIYYTGSVHGVGFRFTSQRIGQQLSLGGWVKNLPDGRVELVAEGEEERLIELLDRIRKSMAGYLSDESIKWQPYKNEFKEFGIRF
ncbi:MAG: acylphosphatase [Candidatus Omnitrophica bacterium]|nr:acylphosphatase [Candidatus Omnitrophota bacterium]